MVVCPRCQTGNSPRSKFCVACGGSLVDSSPSTATDDLPPTTKDSVSGAAPETAGLSTAALAVSDTEVTVRVVPETSSSYSVSTPSVAARVVEPAHLPEETVGHPIEQALEALAQPRFVEPGDDGSVSPVGLALNFHRVFVAGHCTTVQWCVENRFSHPLSRVSVSLHSRGFADGCAAGVGTLAPGQSAVKLVEIEPLKPGNFVLRCQVQFESEGRKQNLVGTFPVRINDVPNTNIVINISDIQSNHATGSNAGLGSEMGSVNISNLVDAKTIKTLNDLLQLELPDDFQKVPLHLDYEVSVDSINYAEKQRGEKLVIPRPLAGVHQPGNQLRLVPEDGGGAPVVFVARRDFKIGRSRQDCDWVAWVLPRSEANDEKTRRISKVHVACDVSDGRVLVRDCSSSRSTLLDGQPLSPTQPVAVGQRGRLALAGVYMLDIDLDAAEGRQGPLISNIAAWPGPDRPPAHPATGAARFTLSEGETLVQEAIWIFTEAAFGSSRANRWVVPGVAEIQGRIYFYRECFWLRDEAPNDFVKINGTNIAPGDIVPMVSGQTLQIGRARYRVEVA